MSTFPIKNNPFFSNDSQNLPKTPRDCPILWNLVFYNFILAGEPYGNALGSFETGIS